MKLLHVIASMDPTSGGPCQGIRNSNQELSKLGVEREVVSLDNSDAPFLGQDVFPVHALGRGKTKWGYNPKLYHWLIENIPRFDVVVINGLWLYHGFAVRQAIRYLNRHYKVGQPPPKVYVMAHGMLDPYFQRAPERKLKAVRNWFYWKLVEGKVISDADGLLFTCETELQLARQTFIPYNPKQELNVGYGIIPPPPYTTAARQAFISKCPAVANKPYLLFLSRIHEKKGIELFITAYIKFFKKLTEAGRQVPMLVIAGPGLDTPYGKKLQKMAGAVAGNIVFPGMLSGDAKWGAFYGCSAFILPSHQENFGIAVVEAMACAKPVLISNQVNIWPEIANSGAGIITEDSEAGAEEMLEKWFSMTVDEQRQMGQNALRCFEDKFHMASVSTLFLDAITA